MLRLLQWQTSRDRVLLHRRSPSLTSAAHSPGSAPVAVLSSWWVPQGFVSCLHYSGRRSLFLIRVNGHLVQCRPLEHSIEALYSQHARAKPFVYLVGGCVNQPAPCAHVLP